MNNSKSSDNTISPELGNLLDLTERLIALIRRENEFLRTHRPSEAASLVEEKAGLSAAYTKEMKAAKANPDILGPKDSPARTELRTLTEAFQNELIRHGRILTRLRVVTEGIVKSIGEEINRDNQPPMGYGATGTMTLSPTSRPACLALDARI